MNTRRIVAVKARRIVSAAGVVFACLAVPGQLAACASVRPQAVATSQREQVFAAERAFAAAMARRDLAAFAEFVADDAIFFTGPTPLRGKEQVVEAWGRFFTSKDAPFSWEPDAVEVLATGALAWSTGPVKDASGKVVARFNSIWRQEAPGVWRVVFDKGTPVVGGA